jgi:DNA mismatch endonuclease (patch repair protein)
MQHDQIVNRLPTRCELALYRYMDEVFGPENWYREAYVLDKWTVDAFVPRLSLVVQADGDWWHGFSEEARKNPTVRGNIGRDQGQNNYLAKIGWSVIRLWEHELLEDQDGCVERLAEVKKRLANSNSEQTIATATPLL